MCEHKSCRDCQTAENGIKADYKVIVAKPFKWFVPASDKDRDMWGRTMYAEVFYCCCSGRWTGSFRISGTGWTVRLMKVFAPLKEVGCHGCCSILPVFAKETEKEGKRNKDRDTEKQT